MTYLNKILLIDDDNDDDDDLFVDDNIEIPFLFVCLVLFKKITRKNSTTKQKSKENAMLHTHKHKIVT